MLTPFNIIALVVLVAFPVIEIALLLKVGQLIGFWATMLIVIGTALAGFDICRRTGSNVVLKLISDLDRGVPPSVSSFDAAIVLIAGLLLVLPGLVTDTFGLILLLPPVRKSIVALAVQSIQAARRAPPPAADPGGSQTIEGEFERLDERNFEPGRRGPHGQRRTPPDT